jgi:hypothetical protein
MKKQGILLSLAILMLVAIGCSPDKKSLLYQEKHEPSGFRFEVYSSPSFSIMPGSSYGGPGKVFVYEREGKIIFKRSISSTAAEITIDENGIFIPGEGVFKFKKKLKPRSPTIRYREPPQLSRIVLRTLRASCSGL